MKNINQLRLSDLISGLTYLENFASKHESFLISAEKGGIHDKEGYEDIKKRWFSINKKIASFRKEINKRMFSKSENVLLAKLQNRLSDDERINLYIKTALKLNVIPKGKKYIDKTLYRKLNNFEFLAKLLVEIKRKSESKHNTPTDKMILLGELEDYINQKLNTAKRKKERTRKQPKTIEYKDDIDNQSKKRKKNILNNN
jgi:CO dehydrogenase/acetyl-CoA synthase epsilon subunit